MTAGTTTRLAQDPGDPAVLFDADDLDKKLLVLVEISAHHSREEAERLATLIVTSVNGIDALKAANERLRKALKDGRKAAVELASLMREGAHDKEEIRWCKVVDRIDAALGGEQK